MARTISRTDKPRGRQVGLTPQQRQELRAVFDQADTNCSGTIDAETFKSVTSDHGYTFPEEDVNRIITEFCQDRNGKIDFDVFCRMIAAKIAEKEAEDELLKAFHVIDQDKNGKVSSADIQRISRELGINFTDKEIQDMVDEADRDRDGEVNADEFMRMMKRTSYTY